MYNLMFGEAKGADVLLATLGLNRADVGRFRDVTVSEGKIAVYTRNGGGNRECWRWMDDEPNEDCDCVGCFMTHRVHKLPYYSHDRDDDFDHTYATIYFDFPPEYAEELRKLDSGEKWDPDARWQKLIASISQERTE